MMSDTIWVLRWWNSRRTWVCSEPSQKVSSTRWIINIFSDSRFILISQAVTILSFTHIENRSYGNFFIWPSLSRCSYQSRWDRHGPRNWICKGSIHLMSLPFRVTQVFFYYIDQGAKWGWGYVCKGAATGCGLPVSIWEGYSLKTMMCAWTIAIWWSRRLVSSLIPDLFSVQGLYN